VVCQIDGDDALVYMFVWHVIWDNKQGKTVNMWVKNKVKPKLVFKKAKNYLSSKFSINFMGHK